MAKELPPKPKVGQYIDHPQLGRVTITDVPSYGCVIVKDAKGQHYNHSCLGWKVTK